MTTLYVILATFLLRDFDDIESRIKAIPESVNPTVAINTITKRAFLNGFIWGCMLSDSIGCREPVLTAIGIIVGAAVALAFRIRCNTAASKAKNGGDDDAV